MVSGVKGKSVLHSLPDFDMIDGNPIDYMHCVLLGVIKQRLLPLWFDSVYHKKPWYVFGDNVSDRICEKGPLYANIDFELLALSSSQARFCLYEILIAKDLPTIVLPSSIVLWLARTSIRQKKTVEKAACRTPRTRIRRRLLGTR